MFHLDNRKQIKGSYDACITQDVLMGRIIRGTLPN